MAHTLTFDVLHEYDPGISGITIPAVLAAGNEAIKTLAKLDTGASCCIFKREHGEALGLNIEHGVRQVIGTATIPFLSYGHNILLSALGFQFDVMVFFAADAGFPRNVLGRHGWLDRVKLALIDYEGKLYASAYDEA